jgi:hypothetical protein
VAVVNANGSMIWARLLQDNHAWFLMKYRVVEKTNDTIVIVSYRHAPVRKLKKKMIEKKIIDLRFKAKKLYLESSVHKKALIFRNPAIILIIYYYVRNRKHFFCLYTVIEQAWKFSRNGKFRVSPKLPPVFL